MNKEKTEYEHFETYGSPISVHKLECCYTSPMNMVSLEKPVYFYGNVCATSSVSHEHSEKMFKFAQEVLLPQFLMNIRRVD